MEDQICVSALTLNRLFSKDNGADLVALYMFYYKMAFKQKTNQPKCSTTYVMKGLGWGKRRVQKAKKELVAMEFIESIKVINKETKTVSAWYIKVKYIKTKKSKAKESQGCTLPPGGDRHPVEINTTNALRINNIKCLKNINININAYKQENKIEIKAEVNKILDIFYKINPTLNYGNKTQRKAISDLIKKFGEEKIIRATEYAVSIQGQKYAPVITNPLELKNKFSQLGIYWKKESDNKILSI